MPYIAPERRPHVNSGLDAVNKGELNFVVYREAMRYLSTHPRSYQNISDAVDALRGAADEVKRRILDPYEDEKITQYGDVVA